MKFKIWSSDSANSLRSERTAAAQRRRAEFIQLGFFRWLRTTTCLICAGHGRLQPLNTFFLPVGWFKQIIGSGFCSQIISVGPQWRVPWLQKSTLKPHCQNTWSRLPLRAVLGRSSALTLETACQFSLINLLDTFPSAGHKRVWLWLEVSCASFQLQLTSCRHNPFPSHLLEAGKWQQIWNLNDLRQCVDLNFLSVI